MSTPVDIRVRDDHRCKAWLELPNIGAPVYPRIQCIRVKGHDSPHTGEAAPLEDITWRAGES